MLSVKFSGGVAPWGRYDRMGGTKTLERKTPRPPAEDVSGGHIPPVPFCNHCGHSVALGSGRFVNRVPDCNDILTRIWNNRQYPFGDFVCEECDSH